MVRQGSDLAFTQNMGAVSPRKWDGVESSEGSTFAAVQGAAQTSDTIENPAFAETPKVPPPTPPKALPPAPPEVLPATQ